MSSAAPDLWLLAPSESSSVAVSGRWPASLRAGLDAAGHQLVDAVHRAEPVGAHFAGRGTPGEPGDVGARTTISAGGANAGRRIELLPRGGSVRFLVAAPTLRARIRARRAAWWALLDGRVDGAARAALSTAGAAAPGAALSITGAPSLLDRVLGDAAGLVHSGYGGVDREVTIERWHPGGVHDFVKVARRPDGPAMPDPAVLDEARAAAIVVPNHRACDFGGREGVVIDDVGGRSCATDDLSMVASALGALHRRAADEESAADRRNGEDLACPAVAPLVGTTPIGPVHGDWILRNIRIVDSGVAAFDWTDAARRGAVLVDVGYFLLRTPRSGPEVLRAWSDASGLEFDPAGLQLALEETWRRIAPRDRTAVVARAEEILTWLR